MNKILLTALALCFSSLTFAVEIQGTITQFSGMTVETRRPYSYIALATKDGQRLKLPKFIKGDQVSSLLKAKMTVDAEVLGMMCTDLSAACLTGSFTDIKSFKISFPKVSAANLKTYSSRLERKSGRAVESRRFYSYIMINDGIRIAVPAFLDAEALLLENAEATVVGMARILMCTDMSAACAPALLAPLKSVEIQF